MSSELQTLQTGEGRHPGDDCEASAEPAESSDDRWVSSSLLELRAQERIHSISFLRNYVPASELNLSLLVFSAAALNTDPTVLGKYRAGFSECMNEVTRFLSTCEGVNTEVRTRLLGHLANCMTQINAMNYPNQHQHQHQHQHQMPSAGGPTHPSFSQSVVQIPNSPPQVLPMNAVPCKGASSPASLPSDATKVYGGFQIVPATDGQFAFLIPNAAFAPNGPVIPVYANNVSTPVPLPAAVSPGAPSGNTDSVWRPW